jgi:lipoprotein NlpD
VWLNLRALAFSAVLSLAACGTQPISVGTYTVKRGDTMYAIAARQGMTVQELARLNRIGRDYVIYPGQVLRLEPGVARSQSQSAQTKSVQTKRVLTPPASNIHWQWPVLNSTYSVTTRPNGGLGLVFNGKPGDEIRTTAAGRVMYSGTGLLGYGQLLIIKHDEVYLSAYGHTQAVRVREGDAVNAGQIIATMGNGPTGMAMLYFEIRVNGQPIDPLLLLQGQK